MTKADLDRLLAKAAAAPPNTRIEFRDRIAAFGEQAISAVQPWLADRLLCRFAVRVIWRVGELGERKRAVDVLREAFTDPTVAVDREDLAFHLRKLGYAAPSEGARTRPRGVQAIPARAGKGWPGFQPIEFRTTDGTHWRAKDGGAALTPLLLVPLRLLHPDDSWSIYHSPEVHFALRSRYTSSGDWAQKFRASKLVTYAHGYTPEHPNALPEVVVGWYVEHGDGAGAAGPMDGRWDWPFFLRALEDAAFGAALVQVMDRHRLRFGDYRGSTFGAAPVARPWVAALEDGEVIVRESLYPERVVGAGLDCVAECLRDVPEGTWRDIHLWRSWPAQEAMAAGGAFASASMLPVLEDLARLYLRVVASAGPTR